MGIFNEFFKKEKPVFTGIARGVGGFGFGGGGGAGASGPTAPFSVSGGTKITSGSYDYHVFTSDSTLEVSGVPGPARILVIAAGGSGGSGFTGNGTYGGGGGGAGGIAYGSNVTLTYGSHTVTIGQPAPALAGGVQNDAGPPYPAAAGGSSTFGHNGSSAEFPYGVKVNGGTPGGNSGNDPSNDPQGSSAAQTGGSTGGASARDWPGPSSPNYSPSGAVTALNSPPDWNFYANAGGPAGTGGPANAAAAGGGGAGGAGGVPPANNHAGSGGAGQPFPAFPGPVIAPAIPNSTPFGAAVGPTGLYGGGGGGGTQTGDTPTATNGTGGSGGGGNGGGGPPDFPFSGYSGINHTGGGAGGSTGNRPSPSTMAVGGKGLVVVRVLTPS